MVGVQPFGSGTSFMGRNSLYCVWGGFLVVASLDGWWRPFVGGEIFMGRGGLYRRGGLYGQISLYG